MTVTKHASRRMKQRGITREAIDFTLRWGTIYYRTGIVFYVLRRRDIVRSKCREAQLQKWEGTTVLVAEDVIISVYKNRDISEIRRKGKTDLAAFYTKRQRSSDAAA